MAAISWKTGTSGSWFTAADWSTGAVPGTADSVTIAVAPASGSTSYTVSLGSSASIGTLALDQAKAELALSFATLTVATKAALTAGDISLYDSTLQGGTYTSTAGTLLSYYYGTLSNLTWNGTLDLQADPSSGYGNFYLNTVAFNGASGAGAGSLAIGPNLSVYLGQTGLQKVLIGLAAGDSLYGTSTALTLASSVLLATTGTGAQTSTTFSMTNGGALVNQGRITDTSGTFLRVTAASIANAGTIAVSGGGTILLTANGSAASTNTGLLSVGAGSVLEILSNGTGALTNSGTDSVAGTLALDLNLTTPQLAGFPVSTGTLAYLGGTITNTGISAGLGTGNKIANFALEGGTFLGGTIVSTGGVTVGSPGYSAPTLDAVAYHGKLALGGVGGANAYNTIYITGGLAMAGAAGSGDGTLTIAPAASVIFTGSQTLSGAVASLGANTAGAYGASITVGTYSEATASTLTLSATTTLTQVSSYFTLATATTSDAYVNDGTIDAAVAGGSVYVNGLTNAGTINIGNGGTINWSGNSSASTQTSVLNSGSIAITGGTLRLEANNSGVTCGLDNTGLISVSGTAAFLTNVYAYGTPGLALANSGTLSLSNGATVGLGIGGPWSNTGTILVSAADLGLYGTFTSAQLGIIKLSGGGALSIGGTLVNTGTFAIGAGSSLPAVGLVGGGEISGGIVHDLGGGITAGGGTLSGVTYDGVLNLAASYASLTVTGGLTVNPATGAGSGTVQVTGNNADLLLLGTETLTNTAIDGGASSGSYAQIGIEDVSGAPSTITLASNTAILQTGQSLDLYGSSTYSNGQYVPSGDTVVNTGRILADQAYGYFAIGNANVRNAGTLAVTNGDQLTITHGTLTNAAGVTITGSALAAGGFAESVLSVGNAASLVNTGTITVNAGGLLVLNTGGAALAFTNSGHVNVAGGNLEYDGTFTTAQLAGVAVSAGGSVSIGSFSTLNNTGATLTVGTGAALGTVSLAGTISGGTIVDRGNGIAYGTSSNNTIDGDLNAVKYLGVLAVGAGETANITGGIALTGANGSGAGSIALTSAGATLSFAGTEFITNMAIAIGSVAGDTIASDNATLSASVLINETGAEAFVGGAYGGGTLTNAGGRIQGALAGGTLALGGTIVNSGTIAVSNGNTLVLNVAALTNTGTISATNSIVDVRSATTAQLEEVKFTNSLLAVTGLLNNAGTTLALGTGAVLPTLELEGTIRSGTITDAGGGLAVYGTGTLDGVAYHGTLAIARPLDQLVITNGLTATDITGKLPGAIAITGAGSQLAWASTQALNNATVSIGNASESYQGTFISAPGIVSTYFYTGNGYLGGTVTLGSQLTVNQANTYADIGGTGGRGYLQTDSGTVTSAATINATFTHGQFSLEGDSFTNTGGIAVSNSATLTVGAANFTNAGAMRIDAGSTMNFDLTNYFGNGVLQPYSFDNTGSIIMLGGSIVELTDNGTFPAVTELNAASGKISGFGTINASFLDNGTITANGGTLTSLQQMSGTGSLVVNAGATFVLAGVSNGVTAAFSGTGGILSLTPASFLGAIGGFAAGDTLDLLNTAAKAASFSGSSLAVTLSTGGTIKLATTSALSGALSVTAGTHGDALIRFAAAAVAPPFLPSLPPALVPPAPIVPAALGLAHDIAPTAATGTVLLPHPAH